MPKVFRVGVVSDSHGDLGLVELALARMGEVEAIVHAGDHYRDSRRLAQMVHVPVIGVAGNCDSGGHPAEELIELGGQRFYVTHGHQHGVKEHHCGIIQVARRYKVDIAVFGHTHIPAMFVQHGILFINPGSTYAGRKGSDRSCAVITIRDTEVHASFFAIAKMSDRAH